MEVQRIIQSEKQWSDMASIEGTEEMTEEQIRAMIDASFDAAMMTEKKDLIKILNYKTGLEESYFSHTRVIGDRSYIAKQSITDDGEAGSGEGKEEMIQTDMNESDLENFKNEWKEKWKPTISQPKTREDEPGILDRFFKMLNPFNRSVAFDRIVQFEQQWSIIEAEEEMTEEKIDAFADRFNTVTTAKGNPFDFKNAMVDGALTEKKVLTIDQNGYWEDIHLSHTRVIGDRSYTAKKSIDDGEEKEELIETLMDIWPSVYRPMDVSEQEKFENEWEEKWNPIIRKEENFKNEWEEKWNPTIREEPGSFERFFNWLNRGIFGLLFTWSNGPYENQNVNYVF